MMGKMKYFISITHKLGASMDLLFTYIFKELIEFSHKKFKITMSQSMRIGDLRQITIFVFQVIQPGPI